MSHDSSKDNQKNTNSRQFYYAVYIASNQIPPPSLSLSLSPYYSLSPCLCLSVCLSVSLSLLPPLFPPTTPSLSPPPPLLATLCLFLSHTLASSLRSSSTSVTSFRHCSFKLTPVTSLTDIDFSTDTNTLYSCVQHSHYCDGLFMHGLQW